MAHKKDNWDFQYAISKVLDGRDHSPWGEALGFSASMITGMVKHGIIPKGTTIGTICEAERASGTWLTTGKGAPFTVWLVYSWAEAKEWLEDFSKYSGNSPIYLATNKSMAALVAVAHIEKTPAKGKDIEYEEVTVIHSLAPQVPPPVATHALHLSEKDFIDLVRGEMGNHKLLKYVEMAEPLQQQKVAEEAAEYVGEDTGELLSHYQHLSSPHQQALLTIARGLDHNGPTTGEFTGWDREATRHKPSRQKKDTLKNGHG